MFDEYIRVSTDNKPVLTLEQNVYNSFDQRVGKYSSIQCYFCLYPVLLRMQSTCLTFEVMDKAGYPL